MSTREGHDSINLEGRVAGNRRQLGPQQWEAMLGLPNLNPNPNPNPKLCRGSQGLGCSVQASVKYRHPTHRGLMPLVRPQDLPQHPVKEATRGGGQNSCGVSAQQQRSRGHMYRQCQA